MKVRVRCNSETCRLDLGIPIVVSAPWPSIDSVCQVCGSGIMVVEGIDQGVTINAASVSEAPPLLDYSLLGVTPEEQLLLDGLEFFGHKKQGGKKRLSGYMNRISPAWQMLYNIHKLSGGIGEQHSANFKDVAEDFMESSDAIKRSLKELEGGAGRGERLSDGFPSMSSKSDNPRKIVLRNLLGTDGSSVGPSSTGYLFRTGVVALDGDGKRVYLTDRAEGLLGLALLPRLSQPDLDKVYVNWIPGPPEMPVFITQEEARTILDFIKETTPDEYRWNMDILSLVVNAAQGHWDSNDYADRVIERCIEEGDFSEWNNWSGDSRLHRYLERGIDGGYGIERGFTELREHVKDKMRSHINGALSGALGRMKELGLIHPVRVGRNKNFKATEFGGEILDDHQSQ